MAFFACSVLESVSGNNWYNLLNSVIWGRKAIRWEHLICCVSRKLAGHWFETTGSLFSFCGGASFGGKLVDSRKMH